MARFRTDIQYWKFSAYGFFKNLRFFDPFIILFFLESGITYFQIGTLVAVREITVNILEIPSGIIADSLGRRKSMVFSFSAYILSFFVFYFFKSYYVYIFAMLFFAFGEAFRTGTHKAMILEYLRRNDMLDLKVLYYGHTRSWSQRGSALSALIAGVIVFTTSSYHRVFLFSIIPYVIELFLMMSYPSYLDFSSHKDDGVKSVKEKALVSMKGIVKILKQYDVRRILVNSSVFDGVFKTLKDYIQPVIGSLIIAVPFFTSAGDKKELAVASGIIYFFLYMLTSFASQHSAGAAGKLGSHESALNTLYLTAVLTALGIGITVFFNLYTLAVILFIIYYVIQNLRRPVMTGYLSGKIDPGAMAAGLSCESQGKTIFVAAAAPLTGFVVDHLGIGAALVFLSILLMALYPFLYLRENKGIKLIKEV